MLVEDMFTFIETYISDECSKMLHRNVFLPDKKLEHLTMKTVDLWRNELSLNLTTEVSDTKSNRSFTYGFQNMVAAPLYIK